PVAAEDHDLRRPLLLKVQERRPARALSLRRPPEEVHPVLAHVGACMRSIPILLALAFVGTGATFAIAHAPDRAEAHEDAREQAEAHACPSANATAVAHANEHARLFRCDANATSAGATHRHDANETDDDNNETADHETSERSGLDTASDHAGSHGA